MTLGARFKTVLGVLLLSVLSLHSEEYRYTTPNRYDFITNIPKDFVSVYEEYGDIDNYLLTGSVIASTILLYQYDDDLIEWAQGVGKRYKIDGNGEETSIVLLPIGPYPIFKIPTSIGSAMYFIGDGTVHIGIMAGMWSYGYFGNDVKALNVGAQLAEGLLDIAIFTQVLKHITGRETPEKMTQPRGKWDFFPNQIDYAKDVPKYDAFPSGHLATAMMSVTILHENYPDNPYILPVGYSLMTLLAYQMLNNGVHWASDYPLAIAAGYSFAHTIAQREKSKKVKVSSWDVAPLVSANSLGFVLDYKY